MKPAVDQVTAIYTVGHSRHPIDHFLRLLDRHAIATLVDVRSHPYSRWAPHFQRSRLSRFLQDAGITYVFLGDALGGRPEGREFYDSLGNLDCARRANAIDFQAGIDRLVQLASKQPTGIMCAEENPDRCHRRLLLAPALENHGISVIYIRGDGRLQSDLTDSAI